MKITIKFEDILKELIPRLDKLNKSLDILIAQGKPVSTRIVLNNPKKEKVMPHVLNGPGKKAAGLSFPELASDGAVLQALDVGGNVVPGGIDPTKTTVAWVTSDPTVITVTVPDPANTTKALLKSTGKTGTGVTVTATLTNVDGSASLPPAVSEPIDVPAGPATQAVIVLGVPV